MENNNLQKYFDGDFQNGNIFDQFKGTEHWAFVKYTQFFDPLFY